MKFDRAPLIHVQLVTVSAGSTVSPKCNLHGMIFLNLFLALFSAF